MGDYETLLVEVTDGVATLTLNRPDVLNAFDITMSGEFDAALRALDEDDAVRAIVVTGAGRAFSSGFDLSAGASTFGAAMHEEHNAQLAVTDEELSERYALWRLRTPIVAAINGLAVGAGLTITLLADVRVAAEDARLRFTFARLNLIPDANSTWLLPRLIGVSRAMELLLSARWFSGAEAAAMGLVSRAVPADEVLGTAVELARSIAANAPVAVGLIKQLVYDSLAETDRLKAFTEETKLTWWTGTQPDTVEGVMSTLEKRDAAWTQSKHTPAPGRD